MNRLAALWREEYGSQTPRERMAHWIELLVKYRHFDHLQIQDDHLNLVQYISLDVIGFLLLIAIASLATVIRLLCRKKTETAAGVDRTTAAKRATRKKLD